METKPCVGNAGPSMISGSDSLQAALRGRYLLHQELGQGGMGIVFLARDLALDRLVAIKLLPPELASLPGIRARFLQEARTAAGLSHPHIVPIFAVEEHGDLVCFVMAYVPGETLAERVRDEGPLPPSFVARLVQEVAWALAYAHQHGVIHRDVKPENILLERGSGRALVTDFGIARIADQVAVTPGQDVMGTPRLVSPEQAAGETLDGRSDLYSLGVTAFFALTGRYPFQGDTAGQLLAQHLTVPAPPVASVRPGTPRALAVAIDRCLAKSPGARFASGEELAEAIGMGPGVTPVPRTLQLIVRELSSFGVDLVGFATLSAIAIFTQLLTADFMGFGLYYTAAVAILLVSLLALRGIQASRLIRDASADGWTAIDLLEAAEHDAREQLVEARRQSPISAKVALYGAGVIALTLFWLGPKQWVFAHSFFPLGLLVELVSLALPIALGRWLGQALESPRDGRPGLLSRLFFRFKAGWLFRVLGDRAKTSRGGVQFVDQPTECFLADQARALLLALPPGERERLGSAADLLGRLTRDAAGLRQRLEDLDGAAAAVGGNATPERREVGTSIAAARHDAEVRLGTTVTALENLRLELLRSRAGLSSADGLTENLAALRRLTDHIDAATEAGDP